MKIIPRRWQRDIIAIGEDEIDLIDWSDVFQASIYLDIWGKIHIELHHQGYQCWFHNTSWRDLLWRQDRVYEDLPKRLCAGARSVCPNNLLGARQFAFIPGINSLISVSLGILHRKDIAARGDAERNPNIDNIRDTAHQRLVAVFDRIAAKLKAQSCYTATSVIDPAAMQAKGWEPYTLRGIFAHCLKWGLTFPLRGQRIYVRQYAT